MRNADELTQLIVALRSSPDTPSSAIQLLKNVRSKKLKNQARHIKRSLVEQKGSCFICGFDYKPVLQTHHILPISQLGTNDPDNIICVCPNCHKMIHVIYASSKKGKDAFDEAAAQAAFYCALHYGMDSVYGLIAVVNRRVTQAQRILDSVSEDLENASH